MVIPVIRQNHFGIYKIIITILLVKSSYGDRLRNVYFLHVNVCLLMSSENFLRYPDSILANIGICTNICVWTDWKNTLILKTHT